MILAIYNCLSIPFYASFNPDPNIYTDVFDYIVDSCFILDILLSFRTSFVHPKTGLEIMDSIQIAKNYLFGNRFIVDILSVIPFETIVTWFDSSTSASQLKLLGLLKLVRLLRLSRVIRYMKFKTGVKIGFRIGQLLFFLLLTVHWVACIWYLLISGSTDWLPPKDLNWQVTDFYDQSVMKQYSIVFYYAILTMVGNDIAPVNNLQTVYATFVVISGALLSAFIFGNIAALMATMNRGTNYYDLSAVTMKSMRVPDNIQDDVYSYLLAIQDTPYLQQDIERFFSILSDPLRKQINAQLYLPMLKKINLLKHADSTEFAFFLSHMKLCLFLPNELIIREDMHGDQMYFISGGSVECFITVKKNDKVYEKKLRLLKQNEYFGEVSLVTCLKRSASVRANDFVYCMKLDRKDYNILEHNFPHLVDEMKKRVREFNDSKMRFRRDAMANIPWLRFIDPEIVKQVLEEVEIQRYGEGGVILKKGHKSDCLYVVLEGSVEILVSEARNETEKEVFDSLNKGSCFCVFTFLDPSSIQMVTFSAVSECVIATLSKQKVMMLEKKFYQIRDSLMKVRVNLLEGTANEFDFYRYLPKRKQPLSDEIRNQIKRKFRAVMKLFVNRVKTSSSKEVETINKMQEMLTLRKFKQYELNDFKIDADITSDDQDLIKNTLIPIADIIKTRTENFQAFQKSNPKLFLDYYRKKAIKCGIQMHNAKFKTKQNNSLSANNSNLDKLAPTQGEPMMNISDINSIKPSRAITEAKLKLAETHEIPAEWEQNIEKVSNLLEYQNARITSIIEDFRQEQEDIEEEIKSVLTHINNKKQ